MRKISVPQISCFFSLLALIILLGVLTTNSLIHLVNFADFNSIVAVSSALFFIYGYAFVIYRLFLRVMPLSEGEFAVGSKEEFAAQVNILFYLMLFNSLIRTHFIPVPLMRLIYLALGARLGDNTYSAGTLLDPPLTEFGDNCIIGHDAVIFCHAIEGTHFSLARVKVGNNVTIGATAVIMSGVIIDDGATVAVGAVVCKGCHIGANEIWGGIPAKRLK